MASVAVIGGGVGAMAAALRLRVEGHDVTLFERRSELGGKLTSSSDQGFTFDIGPSLLTWPSVFAELFACAGVDLSKRLDLVRLANPFAYNFRDGTRFVAADSIEQTEANIASFAGSSGATEWKAFMARAKTSWETAERTFFAGAMESPRRLFQRMESPRDLLAIDPFVSLARRSSASFTDPRMQMWLNRYATYSGSDPWKTPATAACIPYLEQSQGAWHVQGGLATLGTALAEVLIEQGVKIELNADVSAVCLNKGAVDGVTVNHIRVDADVVIAGGDAENLYSNLLPRRRSLRRVKRAGRSTSGFALMLGLRGTTPGLAHHNVWFSADQRKEFRDIATHGTSDDPTIYVCCSSITDPGAAPDGCENWFVLVNTQAGASTDWAAYGDRLIDRLGVKDRVMSRSHLSPQDFAQRYQAPGGAIYGSSSNARSSAFLRAANRGPVKGLYLASGSAHPGGGLPLVALSGKIAAQLVQEDFA